MSMCWEWSGRKKNGYGCYADEYAHRLSYRVLKGPIPDNMCVLHACDNKLCIRPDHLWLGSKADNNTDRADKGRSYESQKTHCIYGHEFTNENTWRNWQGHRYCRACMRRRHNERKDRQQL